MRESAYVCYHKAFKFLASAENFCIREFEKINSQKNTQDSGFLLYVTIVTMTFYLGQSGSKYFLEYTDKL